MKKLLSSISFKTFKGFTLIELLIVITIIGILAVALLPSVLGAPGRARDAQRKADLNNIIAALEVYNSDNGKYPTQAGCLVPSATPPPTPPTTDFDKLIKYFQGQAMPKDPQDKGTGACATTSKATYAYCPLSVPGYSYYLASYMEIPGDGNVKNLSACAGTAPAITKPAPDGANAYVIIK